MDGLKDQLRSGRRPPLISEKKDAKDKTGNNWKLIWMMAGQASNGYNL